MKARPLQCEIRQLRSGAGVSQRRLAAAAGISQGFLSGVETGQLEPSISVLTAIGDALNADLAVRLYPNGGPRIHDRHQARMIGALLEVAHPTWTSMVEVPARAPTHGWIDAVLVSGDRRTVLARESESDLRRLDEQVRRHAAKADSLPSAEFWHVAFPPGEPAPTVVRLRLVRSTAANRAVVAANARMLAAAYPCPAATAHAALISGTAPPRSALLWVAIGTTSAVLHDCLPRDVRPVWPSAADTEPVGGATTARERG